MDTDDTLEKDAKRSVRNYLNLDEGANDEKVRQELAKRIAQMEAAQKEKQKPQKAQPQKGPAPKGPTPKASPQKSQEQKGKEAKQEFGYQEVSLAIAHCPTDASFAAERKRLRDLQVEVRREETIKLHPKLCIQFQDLSWDEYYSGGLSNIKYPDVRAMKANVGKEALLEKMKLFDLLQSERYLCCGFDPAALTPFESEAKFADCPAIIIPSGGKDGKWLKEALGNPKEFWWVRCKGFAQIVFAVSKAEMEAYKPFAENGLTVVGYDGFGMGCGRAAGINIAKKLGRVCIMTDDRTKGLTLTATPKEDITKEQLQSLEQNADQKPFIIGVFPKGELNILTIINPSSSEVDQPVFSPNFIASKEDKALYLYCRALQRRRYGPLDDTIETLKVGDSDWNLQVHFDSNNPPYKNTAPEYKGDKGRAMACATSSKSYQSDAGTPLDWKYLSGPKGFKNQWDAIKMQDSAMFLLLAEIVKDIRDSETLTPEFWDQFDKYITPWFT